VSSAIGLLERSLHRIGLSQPSTPLPRFLSAHGLAEVVLATVLVTVVAISEETIFRGYLILRLSAVTHSTVAAVLLSSVIFSLGHGYEGSAGAVSVGVMGFVFAVVYLWRGSLLAPMVMHFLQDFVGMAVAPLLHHR
jgi:membrane protease YdiL (CAAX protease family)